MQPQVTLPSIMFSESHAYSFSKFHAFLIKQYNHQLIRITEQTIKHGPHIHFPGIYWNGTLSKGEIKFTDKLIEYLWKNPKVMQITTNYAERLTIFPKHILSNLKFPDIKLVPLK